MHCRWEKRNKTVDIGKLLATPSTKVSSEILTRDRKSVRNRQAVVIVMFACAAETPLLRVGHTLFQSLIGIFGGSCKFESKSMIYRALWNVFKAVTRILRTSENNGTTGSVTVEGWRRAHGAPVLGMTWHFAVMIGGLDVL